MATEIWVNIGSDNGLLPDGTKPLPEPLVTDHQWSPGTFILGQFHMRCLKFHSNFPGANELIMLRCTQCPHVMAVYVIFSALILFTDRSFRSNSQVIHELYLNLDIRWVCMEHEMNIMTSSNANIFRVTGPLCGEFTGHRWIPHTKASDAELWCFLWSVPE